MEDMQKNNQSQSGLTLVEILVVISILVLLAMIVIPSYRNYQKQIDVGFEAESIESILRDAQGQAMAVVNGENHGVYFNQAQEQYYLFEGTVYNPASESNITYSLSDKVEFASIDLNETGHTVVFDQLSGSTNNNGTIVIQYKDDSDIQRTITVTAEGKVEI